MARSPVIILTGSPGTTACRRNSTRVTPMKTGITWRTLRAMYLSMGDLDLSCEIRWAGHGGGGAPGFGPPATLLAEDCLSQYYFVAAGATIQHLSNAPRPIGL